MKLKKNILRNLVFEALPDCYLILHPGKEFIILDVNDAYLKITSTTREIIGQPLFKIFPDNPADPLATGVKNLTASLKKVIRTRKAHRMPVQRYDTRIAGTATFETRYWSPLNIPVFDKQGKLQCIIHAVEDVTDTVMLRQHLKMRDHHAEKQITDAISTTQEQERMEISRELHDNINQILLTARIYFGRALHSKTNTKELVQTGYELLGQAISEIKKISLSLLKTDVEETSLVAAINNLLSYVTSFGTIKVEKEIDVPQEALLDPKYKVALFRVTQEAVANVLKHAEAKNLSVRLSVKNKQLTLQVKDDGKGFVPAQKKKGMGFQNMKSRVAMMDGKLLIKSKPGKGTTIVAQVPLNSKS